MANSTAGIGGLRTVLSGEDGICVVRVSGDVDVHTSPRLRQQLAAIIDDGTTDIVLDLTDTKLVDSTGLGVLVGAMKRLQRLDGSMILRSPSNGLQKVLHITGLDQVFTIVG